MIRSLATTIVVLLLSLLTSPAQAIEVPEEMLDLSFDRSAANAVLTLKDATAFIIRADRDITSLRIHCAPVKGKNAAGTWRLRLIKLPKSQLVTVPDFSQVSEKSTLWTATRIIRTDKPSVFTTRAPVPRQDYENWLLTVEPADTAAAAVELRLTATPVDQALRTQWLMLQRNTFNPEIQHDAVRNLVRHLTDVEVRYWTGWRGRENWLRVWRRMNDEQLSKDMPGPEGQGFFGVGHTLPDGRFIHDNTIIHQRPQ